MNFVIRPHTFIRKIFSTLPFSLGTKVDYDGFKKPDYAYGIYMGALQAKRLGFAGVSIIEFGVGKGDGLLFMDEMSAIISKELNINVEVYGFDLGTGLPPPEDYKDSPFLWRENDYPMDAEQLNKKLTRAELILGDVKDTVPQFNKKKIYPIGFIAFDLDFYSSTKNSFEIFNNNSLLPRTYLLFDDVVGSGEELFNEYVGELLAIKEFNQAHKNKIALMNGFSYTRIFPAKWNKKMYVYHQFKHQRYNENNN